MNFMRSGGGRGHGATMPVVKAKNFKGSFRRLLNYLKPFALALIAVLIFAAGSTLFSIVGPKILVRATDALVSGVQLSIVGAGAVDFRFIGGVLLLCLALYVVSALFSFLQGFIMAGVASKVAYNLRTELEHKINKLPFEFFQTSSTGDVLSRITNDVDLLGQNLSTSITQSITSVATFIGVLVMMFTINWQLTLISMAVIPLSLISVMGIIRRSQKYFVRQQTRLGDVNGHIEEMYSGHIVVKAFSGEQAAIEEFDKRNNELSEATWKAQFLSGLLMPSTRFIGNLGYVVVCIAGAAMTFGGTMTIGKIQAFIQYVRNLNEPITQMANISNQIQQTIAAAERVFEFLDEPELAEEHPRFTVCQDDETPSASKLVINGDVTFDHVRFGYDANSPILKDFSVTVKAGQKVAIVGPTGAGKTTIVKLLMRFYDVDAGQILLDGHDIRLFGRENLRTEFGMVLQDTWLFNGTIMDNIRYGKLNATDEEVLSAARAAQAYRFVTTLPDSFEMQLGEDAANISQGQRQLLTIARAILANARVLILDEATSSVDTRTETLIQKAMDTLCRGRTSFVIAHRLSTIRNADIILCVNDGNIVEQGTHDELMKKDGFYSQLYNSQFEAAEESA